LTDAGHKVVNPQFFDTLKVMPNCDMKEIMFKAGQKEINLRYYEDQHVSKARPICLVGYRGVVHTSQE
jgi:hypothetical protein